MAANIIEVTDASFQAEVIESETPVLVLAANVEIFVWPRLLRLASPVM